MDISKIRLENQTYNIKDEEARTNILSIENEIALITKKKKYVFMGDSYADGYTPDGSVTSWITLLVQKLALSQEDYLSVHQGGYGFSYSRSDYNFINLLINLEDDEDLTDMYVCAGYNDMTATSSDILIGIQNFYNLFITKFPNAKLHIGFIGWSKNSSSIRNLQNTYTFYERACKSLQIDLLQGCEYSLHNYYKYFSSDGIHPNQNGQSSIANAIYNCMIYGEARVYEKELMYFTVEGGSSSNAYVPMILKNSNVNFSFNGGNNSAISFNFNETKTQVGNVPIKIATLTNSLLVGTDYNDICLYGIPCVIYDGTNYSKEVIDLIIKNGEIYLVNAGASGNNYSELNFRAIQIPCSSFSINGLLG